MDIAGLIVYDPFGNWDDDNVCTQIEVHKVLIASNFMNVQNIIIIILINNTQRGYLKEKLQRNGRSHCRHKLCLQFLYQ